MKNRIKRIPFFRNHFIVIVDSSGEGGGPSSVLQRLGGGGTDPCWPPTENRPAMSVAVMTVSSFNLSDSPAPPSPSFSSPLLPPSLPLSPLLPPSLLSSLPLAANGRSSTVAASSQPMARAGPFRLLERGDGEGWRGVRTGPCRLLERGVVVGGGEEGGTRLCVLFVAKRDIYQWSGGGAHGKGAVLRTGRRIRFGFAHQSRRCASAGNAWTRTSSSSPPPPTPPTPPPPPPPAGRLADKEDPVSAVQQPFYDTKGAFVAARKGPG